MTTHSQRAHAYLNAMEAGNVDAALACCHDDATFWMPGPGELGKDAIRGFFTQVGPMIKQMVFTIHGITEQGNRVAIEASGAAELANGKAYLNEYHFLFVFRDGLIASMKEYADTAPASVFFE
tara:strand:+ start:1886 stop:2254 length:369 start_codon:yes stop_codon:yes gene_type:complete